MALVSKYFINQGIPIPVFLFYSYLFVAFYTLVEIKLKKIEIKIECKNWLILIFIGIFSMLFNLFMQIGYKFAPNPGYINAINAVSISLITLLSAYFYKDELTLQKIIGVVGVIVGLGLMLI
ncbi:EamA family transporter [Candidatus Beckwithbacteria bacterium]|nr:EamA family transporter [Candidatus Beckwithbacteria bacterium]